MTVSAFLLQMAEKLEARPLPVRDRKPLAFLCRDYASIALFAEARLPKLIGPKVLGE